MIFMRRIQNPQGVLKEESSPASDPDSVPKAVKKARGLLFRQLGSYWMHEYVGFKVVRCWVGD